MNERETQDMNRTQAMQDIQTIKSFLEQGRRKLEDSGFHFILWGLLIPIGFIVFSLIAPRVGYDSLFSRLFWPVLCGVGATVSIVAGLCISRAAGTSVYADSVSTALWIGNLITVGVLFAILFLSGSAFSVFFLAIIAVILGLAYWVYGTIISLRWFSLVALIWWFATLVIACVPIKIAGAVLAATTFVCSCIPGCILYVHKKKGGR